jgi:hypothetical protein
MQFSSLFHEFCDFRLRLFAGRGRSLLSLGGAIFGVFDLATSIGGLHLAHVLFVNGVVLDDGFGVVGSNYATSCLK